MAKAVNKMPHSDEREEKRDTRGEREREREKKTEISSQKRWRKQRNESGEEEMKIEGASERGRQT